MSRFMKEQVLALAMSFVAGTAAGVASAAVWDKISTPGTSKSQLIVNRDASDRNKLQMMSVVWSGGEAVNEKEWTVNNNQNRGVGRVIRKGKVADVPMSWMFSGCRLEVRDALGNLVFPTEMQLTEQGEIMEVVLPFTKDEWFRSRAK